MSFYTRFKRVLIGRPIATKHAHHERLPKRFGLPVFASDALSSVAYASEEIMLVLALAGTMALQFLFPVSLWLGVLMIIVGFSYFQTIHAYPKGGGTYLVSTENLGSFPGRTAGAALLIDYVLTVSVSVSSGISAIISAIPAVKPYAVPVALIAIAIICLANLRGTKESGMLFAIPTYTFVAMVLILIAVGLGRGLGQPHVVPEPSLIPDPTYQYVTIWLLLRAFAASCTALTGTEAIADGVQAFRPPEAKNAATTLVVMIALLLMMFVGLSWMAMHYGIVPKTFGVPGYMTVTAQLAEFHFGKGAFFYGLQAATALILFLAANTAFADFPRLSSFIAKDGYLPRQLLTVGDKLVYQNGIILLAVVAGLLVVIYKADTHSLVPLYAMGVFISFTLSQSGMVARSFRLKKGWRDWHMYVSLAGAITTAIVTVILLITKFEEGAWLIVVALAVMLLIFKLIRNHYDYLAGELKVPDHAEVKPVKTTAILLVPRMHRGIVQAIAYATSMTRDVRALHVTLTPEGAESIKKEWNRFGVDMPLVILESPYRSLIEPIIEYIDQAIAEDPDIVLTVIVPQAVPRVWWHRLLHSNIAVTLKLALASRRNVVVTNVRYFLQ